jgi:hypothetical protein
MVPDQLEHLHRAAEIAGVDIGASVGPRARNVVSNHIRLGVLEWGQPDAPTIVLLHGGSLTAHTWDLICAGTATPSGQPTGTIG